MLNNVIIRMIKFVIDCIYGIIGLGAIALLFYVGIRNDKFIR